MESCNTSLRRLQTDRIDLIQTHGVGSTEMVTLPAVREAFLELKKQGKVRFMGFTNHTQNATLIQDGIATGWYDAILIAYNFMSPPALAAVLTKAKKANVGVVIMKSVAAAAKNAQVVELAAAKQLSPHVAAIKWVMANADVSTCNVGMTTFDQVDEDVTALRGPIQRAESELIEQMRVAVAGNYCQMCEACTPSCPQGIAIADSLRCLMYRESYGNAQLAAENYASVPAARRAGNCTQCGACDHACPFGLRIANRIQQAHRALA
jgi:predicted aldo/keto reductase-like oxidoreductase